MKKADKTKIEQNIKEMIRGYSYCFNPNEVNKAYLKRFSIMRYESALYRGELTVLHLDILESKGITDTYDGIPEEYADVESLKGLKFAAEAGSAGEAAIKENGLDDDYDEYDEDDDEPKKSKGGLIAIGVAIGLLVISLFASSKNNPLNSPDLIFSKIGFTYLVAGHCPILRVIFLVKKLPKGKLLYFVP